MINIFHRHISGFSKIINKINCIRAGLDHLRSIAKPLRPGRALL